MLLGLIFGTLVFVNCVFAESFYDCKSSALVRVKADKDSLSVFCCEEQYDYRWDDGSGVGKKGNIECVDAKSVDGIAYKSLEIRCNEQNISFYWGWYNDQNFLVLHDNMWTSSAVTFEGDNVIMASGMQGHGSASFGGGYEVIKKLGVKANLFLNCGSGYFDETLLQCSKILNFGCLDTKKKIASVNQDSQGVLRSATLDASKFSDFVMNCVDDTYRLEGGMYNFGKVNANKIEATWLDVRSFGGLSTDELVCNGDGNELMLSNCDRRRNYKCGAACIFDDFNACGVGQAMKLTMDSVGKLDLRGTIAFNISKDDSSCNKGGFDHPEVFNSLLVNEGAVVDVGVFCSPALVGSLSIKKLINNGEIRFWRELGLWVTKLRTRGTFVGGSNVDLHILGDDFYRVWQGVEYSECGLVFYELRRKLGESIFRRVQCCADARGKKGWNVNFNISYFGPCSWENIGCLEVKDKDVVGELFVGYGGYINPWPFLCTVIGDIVNENNFIINRGEVGEYVEFLCNNLPNVKDEILSDSVLGDPSVMKPLWDSIVSYYGLDKIKEALRGEKNEFCDCPVFNSMLGLRDLMLFNKPSEDGTYKYDTYKYATYRYDFAVSEVIKLLQGGFKEEWHWARLLREDRDWPVRKNMFEPLLKDWRIALIDSFARWVFLPAPRDDLRRMGTDLLIALSRKFDILFGKMEENDVESICYSDRKIMRIGEWPTDYSELINKDVIIGGKTMWARTAERVGPLSMCRARLLLVSKGV